MNPLFDIETLKTEKGLYESFYFRGNHTDGKKAFWLKHNLLRFNHSTEVRFDNIYIDFDKDSGQPPLIFQQSRILTSKEVNELRSTHWNQFKIEFPDGGFASLTENRLTGSMKGMTWDFTLKRSHSSYFHFDRLWFYKGFFPKKKILTCDTHLEFSDPGKGSFLGMNGHNWGTEHAYSYAYANCNQFTRPDGTPVEAYFDGFSAKIKVGPWVSPYLSSGALLYDRKWYTFNQVSSSFKHPVSRLDSRNWNIRFQGSDQTMEMRISGDSAPSDSIPWVELLYDHPSRKFSKVENTKFAVGALKLFKEGNLVVELHSRFFELETLSEVRKS